MKLFSIQLLRQDASGGDPTVLSASYEVRSFGSSQRSDVRELINFLSKTFIRRTPAGQRQSAQYEEYECHVAMSHDGIGGIVVADHEYPPRVAFALMNKLIDDYDKETRGAWKSVAAGAAPQEWAPLTTALQEYQDPSKPNNISAIQKELDEIEPVQPKTIANVVERGAKLDDLIQHSDHLNVESKVFYKQVKGADQDPTDSGFMAAKTAYGIWNEPDLRSKRIDREALQTVKLLSSDGLHEVWLGEHDDKRVAVKRLVPAEQTKANALVFASEIKLMMQLTHPNITAFVGVEWTKEWEAQAVAEFVERGDLRSLLSSDDGKASTWEEFKCQAAIDVISAIAFANEVRSKETPLEVIKASHVLVVGKAEEEEDQVQCKLSVFAASRVRSIVDASREDSPLQWLAPEIWRDEPVTDRTAIYSFGVLLSELDTTELPFHDAKNPDGSVMSGYKIGLKVSKGELTPSFTSECPEAIAALATECLALEPAERPSAASITYRLREILKNEL